MTDLEIDRWRELFTTGRNRKLTGAERVELMELSGKLADWLKSESPQNTSVTSRNAFGMF